MTTDSTERLALEILSAALDMPSGERDAWAAAQCGDDAALQKRVRALLATAGSASGLLMTGGAGRDSHEPPAPERVGAYRITGTIGQGGMGAVYKGARISGNFDQTVAIKVIRPGVLSDMLIERFVRERQILATLNHPNIARLYDGGEMPDGAPYMIMEYVDGEPILAWAERTGASLDERLDLYAALCNAVQFAHQNLIIHRDITPSNVLVSRDGHVKLIDFGISKPQETVPGRLITPADARDVLSYTPGYAAPERARGAAANTLSDIFSLGKLLADLTRPEERTPELSAIIARASASDPAERYASVTALEEDLANYRAGHPVTAYGGSAAYRVRKFIGRHRGGVLAVAGVILGLTAALTVTVLQYNRAEAALAVANDRFTQARQLSRTLVFDVYDTAQQVSGTMETRTALANVVRDYIQGLELDDAAPDDVLLEVGIITSRLADLYGGIGIANLGETETSNQLFRDARAALQEVIARNPADAVARAELVMAERMLTMQALYFGNALAEARELNASAAAHAEAGLALKPENERPLLRHMWSVRTDLLQLLLAAGETEEALSLVRAWRAELTPEMLERLGNGGEMGAYLAMQEASFLIREERGAEAIAPLEFTIAHRTAELEKSPENYYQKTQLMVAVGELATATRLAGDLAAARANAARATQLAREIMAADPDDAGGPEGLSAMLQKVATAESASGNHDAARRALDESAILFEDLIAAFPGESFYEYRMLNILSQTVQVDAAAGPSTSWSCGRVRAAERRFDVAARLANPEPDWNLEGMAALAESGCFS
ncbi:serine/threonine-protein kinase [Hyphomonas sp.]|uniref:serine/threonine-protein kinase n=1 Tax=Hyphomonas sp. TaxID=87 RepID=UPI0039197079